MASKVRNIKPNRFISEEFNKKTGAVTYTFLFGKFKGETLFDVLMDDANKGYIRWMMRDMEDMPEDVRSLLEDELG